MPRILLTIGLLRTFLFGGWAYITSRDDGPVHEIFGIGYLICAIPWTVGVIIMAPSNRRTRRYRTIIATCLYATWIPMVFLLHST